jgi:uncharacterized cupredoxin-like copper-binding protein
MQFARFVKGQGFVNRQSTRFRTAGLTTFSLAVLLALVAFVGGRWWASAQPASPTSEAGTCPAATPVASPAASPQATTVAMPDATPVAGSCVAIGMHDIFFQPNEVTIPANQPVTIVLANEGVTMHNFSVTDHGNQGQTNLNISFNVQPGESKAVTINAPAGDYYFYCNVPGHEAAGMVGVLHVQEGGQISAQSATVTPVTSG